VPIVERAVPLIDAAEADAVRARVAREVASGADAVVVKPGLVALDHLTRVAASSPRPIFSFFTADEHALYANNEALPDGAALEREAIAAARRAGADFVISYGALAAAES
jgi:porphobilinogen synthase